MSKREDRAWRDYSERFRNKVFPKMIESALFIQIAQDWADGDDDPSGVVKAATEIGFCLLMGKPLLVVAPTGVTLSRGIVKAADVIVYDADMTDPKTQDRLAEAIEELNKLDPSKGT